MNYKYIVNPITNRKVKTTTILGQHILKNYIISMRGGGLNSITKHKDSLTDLAKKQKDKVETEAKTILNNTVKDTKEKIKKMADIKYWDNLGDEIKCEFCTDPPGRTMRNPN